MEPHYPLHARVCGSCLLVQLPAVQTAEAIFSDYAYFSSYSDSWLEHARRYVAGDRPGARARRRLAGGRDRVERRLPAAPLSRPGIGVLGVEPAANVAAAAIAAGIDTEVAFFGRAYAAEPRRAAAGTPT